MRSYIFSDGGRRHVCSWCWAALVAVLSVIQSAQGETLKESMRSAYVSNPTLHAAHADLLSDKENYSKAKADLGPVVDASIGTMSTSSSVDEESIFGNLNKGNYNSITTETSEVSISQTLFNSGRTSAKINAAQADYLGSIQQYRQNEASIVYSIIQNYEGVRLNRKAVEISTSSLKLLEEATFAIQEKYNAGAANATDLSQANARLISAKVQLSKVRADLSASEQSFAAIVGHLPGPLEAPDIPINANDSTVVLRIAEQNNPQLLFAKYNEKSAAARLLAAKAQRGPSVLASASYGRQPEAPYRPLYARNATMGVTVRWRLYSSGLTSAGIRQADTSKEAASLRAEATQKDLYFNIMSQWQDLHASMQTLNLLNAQEREEKIAFESSREQYRAGLTSTINFLNAEREMQEAQMAIAKAENDLAINKATLLRSEGVLDFAFFDVSGDAFGDRRPQALQTPLSPWENFILRLDGISTPTSKH